MGSNTIVKTGIWLLVGSILVNAVMAFFLLFLKNRIRQTAEAFNATYYKTNLIEENEGYKYDSAAFNDYVRRVKECNYIPSKKPYYAWHLCDKPFSEYVIAYGRPIWFEGPDTLSYGRKDGFFAITRFMDHPVNNPAYYHISKRLNKAFVKMYQGKWNVSDSVSIVAYFIEDSNDTLSIYGEPNGIYVYE